MQSICDFNNLYKYSEELSQLLTTLVCSLMSVHCVTLQFDSKTDVS